MIFFEKAKKFIKIQLCLRHIRKAENIEELVAAKEEARELDIEEVEILAAISSGRESALKKIASSDNFEQYQPALARAEMFGCDSDAIGNAISVAKNKILGTMGKAFDINAFNSSKTFAIQLGATNEEIKTAEIACINEVLNHIRECLTDSKLTSLQAFAKELPIDANDMSEALKHCKEKSLSKLSEAGDINELEDLLNMANHCGSSYEEISIAKKSAQPLILNRLQISDSIESAKNLVAVAVSLGIDYNLIESTLNRVKEQQLLKIQRQTNFFFAGSKSLQAERDLFSNVISILQTKWQGKRIDIFGFSYENFKHEITESSPQDDYNNFIRNNTDVIVFVLNGNIGGITQQEFNVAFEAFKTNGHPKILVYSKQTDTPDNNIVAIRQRVNEVSQYWQDYVDNNQLRPMIQNDLTEHIQTVYEEMVQQKKKILG